MAGEGIFEATGIQQTIRTYSINIHGYVEYTYTRIYTQMNIFIYTCSHQPPSRGVESDRTGR